METICIFLSSSISKPVQRHSAAATTASQLTAHHQHVCRDHTTTSRGGSSSSRAPRLRSLQWIWSAVLLCACISSSLANGTTAAEQPTVTTDSPTPPVFNFNDCKNSFDTADQKRYICYSRRDLFPILVYAEAVAKKTCEEDFKHNLWNCTGFSLLKEPSITEGDKVFPESAYVYAMSLAVITHTVVEGCSKNIIGNCSCNVESEKATVCPDSVEYGLRIAETFLHKRYSSTGGGVKQLVAHHNFRATRHIIYQVMNSTEKSCHCHGISGSCTFSICHSKLPDFQALAGKIKEAYSRSCRVASGGQSRLTLESQCGRDYTDSDFIHMDRNNWCEVNPAIGSTGVSGRECSPEPDAANACNKLCTACGRGSKEHMFEKVSQCDCRFEFCCDIKCKTCTEQKTSFRCT